jgi:hypothetical protein
MFKALTYDIAYLVEYRVFIYGDIHALFIFLSE